MPHRVAGSPRFYASVDVPGRRTLRVAGFPQRRLTEQLERALELLAAHRSQGTKPDPDLVRYFDGLPDRIKRRLVTLDLVDPVAADTRSLAAVLGSPKDAAPGTYESYLRAKGNTLGHARQQASRARRVLVAKCRLKHVSEISADLVLRALADLRAEGMGAVTSNAYRVACRGLTKWLAREGLLLSDPLAHLERVKAESRSDRRALTAEEQALLVATTRTQPRRGGLSGEARSLLYLLALQTGLRRGELLALTRGNFQLDAESPSVTIEHGQAKNRRTARIPLQPETVGVLRGFLAEAMPAAPLFRGFRRDYRAAEVLRHDLKAAGIPERTEAGQVDFHALRVSYVTSLARAGVPLALAQKLARHSTPMLTAGVYSRFAVEEDVAAIAKLPSLATAAR